MGDKKIASYSFNFGDGSLDVNTTENYASHTYFVPGNFTVLVSAYDEQNLSCDYSIIVVVNDIDYESDSYIKTENEETTELESNTAPTQTYDDTQSVETVLEKSSTSTCSPVPSESLQSDSSGVVVETQVTTFDTPETTSETDSDQIDQQLNKLQKDKLGVSIVGIVLGSLLAVVLIVFAVMKIIDT